MQTVEQQANNRRVSAKLRRSGVGLGVGMVVLMMLRNCTKFKQTMDLVSNVTGGRRGWVVAEEFHSSAKKAAFVSF